MTEPLKTGITGEYRCPQCLNRVCRHAIDTNKAVIICHACELTWPA